MPSSAVQTPLSCEQLLLVLTPLREALERIERKAKPLPAACPHQQRLGLIDAVYQSK